MYHVNEDNLVIIQYKISGCNGNPKSKFLPVELDT